MIDSSKNLNEYYSNTIHIYKEEISENPLKIIKNKVNKRKSKFPLFFLSSFFITFLILIVFQLYLRNLNINSNQSNTKINEKKQAQLANILGAETKSTNEYYSSKENGYLFQFNPTYWLIESQSTDSVKLFLRKQYGSANFSLRKLINYESLDIALKEITNENLKTQSITGKIISEEKTIFNSYDAYKLTLKVDLLGSSFNTYQYIIKSKNN